MRLTLSSNPGYCIVHFFLIMPPKKRTAGPGSRSKRLRSLPPASDLQEAEPAAIVQDIQFTAVPGMVQLNL